MWYIYTKEFYSAITKAGIMPFADTLMDLEISILSEVRQRQISYDITYMWNLIKMVSKNLFKEQKKTHVFLHQSYSYHR